MPDAPNATPRLMGGTAYVAGFALGGSLIVAIGAQNVFVLRQGLRREHVALVVTVCALLDVALLAVGVSGVATAAGARPWLLQAVAAAGIAVLLWYGANAAWRAWHQDALRATTGGAALPWRRTLAQTVAITLLNPHVYLDTVLLVGSIAAQQPPSARPVFFAGAASASIAWFSALGFGARWLAPLFARPVAWRVLDTLVAVTMLGMAAALAARFWPA